MYQSTIEALNALYDKLSVGGYCIIDDYNWQRCGCKQAVDDYILEKKLDLKLIPIDNIGVYWKKWIIKCFTKKKADFEVVPKKPKNKIEIRQPKKRGRKRIHPGLFKDKYKVHTLR